MFLMFTPKIGEDEPILTIIFEVGWFNHQLDDFMFQIPSSIKQK